MDGMWVTDGRGQRLTIPRTDKGNEEKRIKEDVGVGDRVGIEGAGRARNLLHDNKMRRRESCTRTSPTPLDRARWLSQSFAGAYSGGMHVGVWK